MLSADGATPARDAAEDSAGKPSSPQGRRCENCVAAEDCADWIGQQAHVRMFAQRRCTEPRRAEERVQALQAAVMFTWCLDFVATMPDDRAETMETAEAGETGLPGGSAPRRPSSGEPSAGREGRDEWEAPPA